MVKLKYLKLLGAAGLGLALVACAGVEIIDRPGEDAPPVARVVAPEVEESLPAPLQDAPAQPAEGSAPAPAEPAAVAEAPAEEAVQAGDTARQGPTEEQAQLLAGLASQGPAPELHNQVWLNSDPLKLADVRGQVVMVEFWTFG